MRQALLVDKLLVRKTSKRPSRLAVAHRAWYRSVLRNQVPLRLPRSGWELIPSKPILLVLEKWFRLSRPLEQLPICLTLCMQGEHSKNDSTLSEASPSASTASNNPPPRHKTPSKRAFTTRRSAYKIIRRLGEKPIDELTEQERSSLQWAKTHIAGLKSDPPPEDDNRPKRSLSDAAPKRQRSEEDTLPRSKRSRNLPQQQHVRSYKEVAKDHLIWAIIDRNASDGTISSGNWKLVVMALSEAFLKFVRQHPGPPTPM